MSNVAFAVRRAVSAVSAVTSQARVSPETLTGEQELHSLGISDDRSASAVLQAMEEELDVRFPDDFLDGLTTVGDLTSAVRIAIGE